MITLASSSSPRSPEDEVMLPPSFSPPGGPPASQSSRHTFLTPRTTIRATPLRGFARRGTDVVGNHVDDDEDSADTFGDLEPPTVRRSHHYPDQMAAFRPGW